MVLTHLQEKLHQNLCRQRSLVSVGTHDLATVKPPFTYEALPPAAISFVPLKQEREFRADELLDVSSWSVQPRSRSSPMTAKRYRLAARSATSCAKSPALFLLFWYLNAHSGQESIQSAAS